MGGESYFYFGFGVLFIFVIIGLVGLSYMPQSKLLDEAKITLELSTESEIKEFSSKISQKELFSENPVILTFSPAVDTVYFSGELIECEVSCKKG